MLSCLSHTLRVKAIEWHIREMAETQYGLRGSESCHRCDNAVRDKKGLVSSSFGEIEKLMVRCAYTILDQVPVVQRRRWRSMTELAD